MCLIRATIIAASIKNFGRNEIESNGNQVVFFQALKLLAEGSRLDEQRTFTQTQTAVAASIWWRPIFPLA
jgi:hypothetical protein